MAGMKGEKMNRRNLQIGETYIYRRRKRDTKSGEWLTINRKVRLIELYPHIAVFDQGAGKRLALNWWEVRKKLHHYTERE